MNTATALLATGGLGAVKTFVEDVFACHTYSGNGATQTINNGIDLAGRGGMVWFKSRSGAFNHALIDTARGGGKVLSSNATSAQADYSPQGISAFNSNGFAVGTTTTELNSSGSDYASWTFRRAAKFHDVVTWTGDGASVRQIPHALGQSPGMFVVKSTSLTNIWAVYHRSLGNNKVLILNATDAAATSASYWNSTDPTAAVFTVDIANNSTGNTYVAYLFAHDTSADGLIQCGSFVATGTTETINLGYETQFVLLKNITTASDWEIYDTARGATASNVSSKLLANTSAAEISEANRLAPTATGFTYKNGINTQTYIYMAIRRGPMRFPTTGTQVYNAIARTGTGAVAQVTGVGFAPDLIHTRDRTATGFTALFNDRLRGSTLNIYPQTVNAEASSPNMYTSFDQDGATVGANPTPNNSGTTYINHFFRRYPGVYDQVCYSVVTQTAPFVINHNLKVPPELIITKGRNDGVQNWQVRHIGLNLRLGLNTTEQGYSVNAFSVSSSSYTINASDNALNQANTNYVAYLFASLPGISKVGSYTGNGTTQTIPCGFTAGARFFLVKATSTTGNWWIFDSVRGIISAADPVLALNSTAAEITSADAVDPAPSGIIVNEEVTCSINASGISYIFLAIA